MEMVVDECGALAEWCFGRVVHWQSGALAEED